MIESRFFEWVETLPLSVAIAESDWLFPTIETVHVLAIALVVGSIGMIDLRLVGWAWRDRRVSELTAEILPWTWASFVVAALSGLLMWISAAVQYSENLPFWTKMGILVLAGINMMVFHFVTQRDSDHWDMRLPTPGAVRLAGTLSLAFWVSIVTFGRWIGFV